MTRDSARAGAHRHGFLRWTRPVARVAANHWKSVFFSAAIALILEHAGILSLCTKLSWLLVSSLAAQGPAAKVEVRPGTPAVVLIAEADFNERYGEKTPLNRCILEQDVKSVLQKSPSRLAIDFDLSPLASPSDPERDCQGKLDALLDANADKLVLLVPMPAAGKKLRDVKHEWMAQRCRAGLHFADGSLENSLGVVIGHAVGNEPALKARLADQLHGAFSDYVCETAVATTDAAGNRWLGRGEIAPSRSSQAEGAPLSFSQALRRLAVVHLTDKNFPGLSLRGSPVVLGGEWGQDDISVTPMGVHPGAVIHGARLISLEQPVRTPSPVLALAADIAIAMCFAWLVHAFWAGYVRVRRAEYRIERVLAFRSGHQTRRIGLSTLLMISFVLIYFALTAFFILAAQFLFQYASLVLAPLLISVSMLIDGFVSGPVDQIQELVEEEYARKHAEAPDGPTGVADSYRDDVVRQIRFFVWALVAVAAVCLAGLFGSTALPGIVFVVGVASLWLGLLLHLVAHASERRWWSGQPQGAEPRARAWSLQVLSALGVAPATLLRRIGTAGVRRDVSSPLRGALVCLAPSSATGRRAWRDARSFGRALARVRALAFWGVLVFASVLLIHP